jgi:outer membrane protein assembly factor BamB
MDVYVGTADGTLHRVAVDSGRVLASRRLDPNLKPSSVPVRTAGSILVLLTDPGADYRVLMAVDPALDRVRWQVKAETSWSTSRVFVWGDVVVLGTSSGDVVGYCKETGARSWTRTVKGPIRAIGGSGNTLLVGTRTGGLSALSAPQSCSTK